MKKELQSLIQTTKNVTKGFVQTGRILATDPEHRMKICYDCPYILNKRCLKCGCYLPFKTKLEFARCTIGRW